MARLRVVILVVNVKLSYSVSFVLDYCVLVISVLLFSGCDCHCRRIFRWWWCWFCRFVICTCRSLSFHLVVALFVCDCSLSLSSGWIHCRCRRFPCRYRISCHSSLFLFSWPFIGCVVSYRVVIVAHERHWHQICIWLPVVMFANQLGVGRWRYFLCRTTARSRQKQQKVIGVESSSAVWMFG